MMMTDSTLARLPRRYSRSLRGMIYRAILSFCIVRTGHSVLGSRSQRLEKGVTALMAEPLIYRCNSSSSSSL